MEAYTSETSQVGVGIYTMAEAARLVGSPSRQVRRWALGYPFPSRGKTRLSPPVILSKPLQLEKQYAITFRQLIELRFVRLFRQHGVSMPVIRAAARNAAQQLQTATPFGMRRFYTDGRAIFASMKAADVRFDEDQEKVTEADVLQQLDKAQIVMGDIARVFFKDVEYDQDFARHWWLLGSAEQRAILDPHRGFGQPLDAPSGVPLSSLYAPVQSGESVEAIADWFDVPMTAVDAAIAFYERYP